jgi:phosphoglycolate phosphatase-like HAD superfamily hydrolase
VIKDVLWEVDGVLFDTYTAITYAASQALQTLGHTLALNVIDGLVRRSPDGLMQALAGRFELPPDRLRREFSACYREVPALRQPPLPGVGEICVFIHHRNGVNLALTHRNSGCIQPLLDVHGLALFFRTVVSTAYTPYPGLLQFVLTRYKLQAGRSAYIRTCQYGQATITTSAEMRITQYSELFNILPDER